MADPAWFPTHLDRASGSLRFVRTDYPIIASQSFLDHRWDRGLLEQNSTGVSSLLPLLPPEQPNLNLIWHTGFCCSTLLAKAVTEPASNLSLCEPQILVDVAEAKRAPQTRASDVPKLVLHLLARRLSREIAVTVKPAPAANVLLRDAATQTAGSMLFLYSDCGSFLVSVAKLATEGRNYARRMFLAILGDGHPQGQWSPKQLLSLSDLQVAALLWHMQIDEFLRSWPLVESRARSLDCEAFLADPVETLIRLDDFFSLGLGRNKILEVTSGPVFRTNAKDGRSPLDAESRRGQNEAVIRRLGTELERIVAWSYEVCPATPRGAPLPNPLVTIEKKYV